MKGKQILMSMVSARDDQEFRVRCQFDPKTMEHMEPDQREWCAISDLATMLRELAKKIVEVQRKSPPGEIGSYRIDILVDAGIVNQDQTPDDIQALFEP